MGGWVGGSAGHPGIRHLGRWDGEEQQACLTLLSYLAWPGEGEGACPTWPGLALLSYLAWPGEGEGEGGWG